MPPPNLRFKCPQRCTKRQNHPQGSEQKINKDCKLHNFWDKFHHPLYGRRCCYKVHSRALSHVLYLEPEQQNPPKGRNQHSNPLTLPLPMGPESKDRGVPAPGTQKLSSEPARSLILFLPTSAPSFIDPSRKHYSQHRTCYHLGILGCIANEKKQN